MLIFTNAELDCIAFEHATQGYDFCECLAVIAELALEA